MLITLEGIEGSGKTSQIRHIAAFLEKRGHRCVLTREPADFFGLDVGRLNVGARADMALINPDALRNYDGEASIEYVYRDIFDCHQLVNRSEGVVDSVYVGGAPVWHGTEFTAEHGSVRLGQALKVGA